MKDLVQVLNSKDISRDDFSLDIDKYKIVNYYSLYYFYEKELQNAERLVLEDEFVGRTFDNLDLIRNLLVKLYMEALNNGLINSDSKESNKVLVKTRKRA